MSRIAHVTRARAPYLRALQEAFALAMGDNGSLHLLWPQKEHSDFPDTAAVPTGENIDIVEVPMGRTLGNGARLPSPALWRALDQARPDLVWVHEFSPYTVAGLCYAKRRGLPVVVSTEVGQRNAHFFPWTVRLWHQHWGHFADGIIANCPAAREPLCNEARPVVDAFHAVDSRTFLPSSNSHGNGTTTFAFVGHLIPRKGIDLLLDAAVTLKQQGRGDFRLKLIGRDAEGWASNEVAERGLGDVVDMAGFLSGEALRDAIRAADVFVLPTRKDTYAAVVHEAACLGMPLLISRHAGACEALVREGEAGFSFLPEDREGFAGQMRRMLDPDLRQRMRKASRDAGDAISAHRRGPALWEWMKKEFTL